MAGDDDATAEEQQQQQQGAIKWYMARGCVLCPQPQLPHISVRATAASQRCEGHSCLT